MEAGPQPGTVLAERYRLIRPLARGGMGSVWRAEHLTLASEVAVKIIDPAVARRELGLQRFLREARALASLHSPHIVQVIDFGSEGEVAFLVMELLAGRTLGQRLKAEGKLSASETLRVLGDVCKAMSHAHERGIVHRDLKPENIFLCDATRDNVTKVLDFGIAKPLGTGGAGPTDTGTGAFLGTPSYMSPEQCRGSEIDHRADVWAIGAIAHECLVGERLFSGDVVGDIVVRICTGELPVAPGASSLPPGFRGWLERAMAREPGDRFESAAQLFAALSAVLEGAAAQGPGADAAETLSVLPPLAERGSAAPSSTLARGAVAGSAPDAPRQRRPALAVLAAALAGAGALAGAVALLDGEPASQPAPSAPLTSASAPIEALAAAKPHASRAAAQPAQAAAPAAIGRPPAEARDAGAREAAQRPENSSAEAPRTPASRPARKRRPPREPPPEMELLRRTR